MRIDEYAKESSELVLKDQSYNVHLERLYYPLVRLVGNGRRASEEILDKATYSQKAAMRAGRKLLRKLGKEKVLSEMKPFSSWKVDIDDCKEESSLWQDMKRQTMNLSEISFETRCSLVVQMTKIGEILLDRSKLTDKGERSWINVRF